MSIEADLRAIFTDIGEPATYNGADIMIIPQGRTVQFNGSARQSTAEFIVRCSDVSDPQPMDVIVYDGVTWEVDDPDGEPVTGGNGTWNVKGVQYRRPSFK